LRKIPLALLLAAAVASILAGLRYLFTAEFMPYHAAVASQEWSALQPGIQTIFLGMLRIAGGAFLAFGIALLWLLVPLNRGEHWAPWAVVTVAGAVWLPTLYVVLALRAAAPRAEPPLLPTLFILSLVILAVALLFLKPAVKALLARAAHSRSGHNAKGAAAGAGPLAGKVALVTGSSRGIGAAIAKRLAADGAAVALTYSTSPDKAAEIVQQIEAAGGKALAIRADAGDPIAIKAAVDQVVGAMGPVDILVNNAGINIGGPLNDISHADFDRMIAVNVKGYLVMAQEAVRQMRNGGRVINIGSINSVYAPYNGAALYVLTKAAVAGLTKALARELGPRAITVNNVMAGPTDTDMNPASGSFAQTARAAMALQRYADPDEIADMVAYLATPGAGFVTGASLAVDGGYSA
jgi:3-oxoacyl-[acyl-carrier protein] reductase